MRPDWWIIGLGVAVLVLCVWWLLRQDFGGTGHDQGYTKPRGWREHNWATHPTPQLPDQEEQTPPLDKTL